MNNAWEMLIQIAESFNKWLDDASEEYHMNKSELQELVKQFLTGGV